MIRPIATEIALFITPFVLYAVFLFVTRSGIFHPENWPLGRVAWLTIAALVLVVGSFIYFAHFTGAKPGSAYIPAHMEEWDPLESTCRHASLSIL